MMTPAPDDAPGNVPEISVSELSAAVRRTVEDRFGFVRVRGEIGRISRPRSGHLYLTLKDDRANLDAVMWKGVAARQAHPAEEGMEVIAEGKLTTYAGQSKYQLVIDRLVPAGAGALMMMLEKRRKALAAEGLFDEGRKRALPYLPEVIGVVTSPSGAVIRDILHRLADRFPRHVLVWPVAVQGQASAGQVAAAIGGFNALAPGGPVPRPDVIIVARGGGSLEDLWGFNEEIVVRAAAASAIPLISAVGHETDTTLIDFAADRRAPTPTAAAEMAVPVRSELLGAIAGLEERRLGALTRAMRERRRGFRDLARALPRPEALLAERRQRLDTAAEALPRALALAARRHERRLARAVAGLTPAMLRQRAARAGEALRLTGGRLEPGAGTAHRRAGERLHGLARRLGPPMLTRQASGAAQALGTASDRLTRAMDRRRSAERERLAGLSRLLTSYSHRSILARGFALVRNAQGAPLRRAGAVPAGEALTIEFEDGTISATAGQEAGVARKPARRRQSPDPPPGQGSLF